MNIMGVLGRVFCSKPVSYFLGVGAGLVGLYLVYKAEENRKLQNVQKEIEAAVKAIEVKKKEQLKLRRNPNPKNSSLVILKRKERKERG